MLEEPLVLSPQHSAWDSKIIIHLMNLKSGHLDKVFQGERIQPKGKGQ